MSPSSLLPAFVSLSASNPTDTVIPKIVEGEIESNKIRVKSIQQLGAQEVEIGTRAVSFKGDKGFMYKANLSLRTALKILKPIYFFKATNDQNLYKGIQGIDWSKYIGENQTFVIDTTIHSDNFKHSQFVSQKAKDAIVDQFREKTGQRPSIDKDFPDLRINIHIDRDQVSVALDTSGASLHHRGYRTATNIAPINEVLAAGMLLLSGWDGSYDFLDPMCGSGTLLAEAAMIACNIPANINRKEFAFEKWNDWDNDLFDQIIDALMIFLELPDVDNPISISPLFILPSTNLEYTTS